MRRLVTAVGCVLLAALIAVVFQWNSPPHPSIPQTEKPRDSPSLSQSGDREYGQQSFLGTAACARCHAEIAEQYARSPMSHSWRSVEAGVPGELLSPGSVTDSPLEYEYEVFEKEGRLVQRESLTDDDSEHELIRHASYFIGSGNHACAMISSENGYLTQLPVGWFSHEDNWKLNPGYELVNQRFDRPIRPECLSCHGGFALPHEPTRNRYELPVSGGISCEHCHGSGKDHIAFHETPPESSRFDRRDSIVNPSRLSAQRANDVCQQCHLQGDITVYRERADAFSFRPGDLLTDHRLDFLLKTDGRESFGVASHASRMQQSRCFTASQSQLTCMTCHNPHRPVSDFSPEFYSSKCNSCHAADDCHRPASLRDPSQPSACVRCHMPQRETREGQHLIFTDHLIRIPAPADRELEQPPVLPPNARVELIAANSTDDLQQHKYLGMAYIKLHTSMGPQTPSLSKGVRLLTAAQSREPDNQQIPYWLATGLIAEYRGAEAIRILRELLSRNPHHQQARYRLAVAYDQQKDFDLAIAEYERLIREVPDWLQPYPLVVRLHLSRGQTADAVRLLQQQLSYRDDETARLNLALAYSLEEKPLEQSLRQIAASLRLNPRNPTAYNTRAYLYRVAGDFSAARTDYGRALQIDPSDNEALAGLKTLPKK